jgi:hypothetical protein
VARLASAARLWAFATDLREPSALRGTPNPDSQSSASV